MAFGTRQASITSASFQSWRNDLVHTAGEAQRLRDSSPFVRRAAQPANLISNFSRRSRVDSPSLTAEGSQSSEEQPTSPAKRVTIGIDYGTTYSGISYATIPLDEDESFTVRAADIKTIKYWPDEPTGLAQQCPTELWYPAVAIPRAPAYNQFDAPKVIPSTGTILYDDGEEEEEEEEEEESSTSFDGSSRACMDVNRGGGTSVPEEDLSDNGFDDDRSTKLLWGYSVSEQQYEQNSARNPARLIRLPKLMMLSTSYTEGNRRKLRYQINDLLRKNIIRKYGRKNVSDMRDIRDVSTDYLIRLLGHAKEQLVIHEGYTEDWPVTFAIAVPATWSPEASRILQFSMEAAILATGFGSLTNGKDFGSLTAGSIDNLFIAPEPECGAMWLLHNTNGITAKTIVTSLDCGGGTVDAVTYEVAHGYPVRLGRVVVDPSGDNCGSSYLNENFKIRAKYRLRDEKYLEDNGDTLKSIIDRVCVKFENFIKRSVDITSKHPHGRFYISKLRGDKAQGRSGAAAKGFENNILVMKRSSDDFEFIFVPILKRVWNVLQSQLDAAFAKNEKVEMVFLFGGFAASPSLVNYLKNNLKRYEKHLNLPYSIRLVEDPQKTVNAISSGAVLRALNTTHGPPRLGQSSYGFLRKEPYQKNIWQGHKRISPERDEVDGELYVTVINYFMIKERLVDERHEFEPIKCCHTFQVEDLDMKCEELLYVSDTATESHYKLTSKKNRGAQVAWKIITDMTFLKNEGHIEITQPKPDEHGVLRGQPHYVVEYDIVPIVEKRNLRLEARWPASRTPEERSHSADENPSEERSAKRRRIEQITVKVQMTAQLSIAATFQPGTA